MHEVSFRGDDFYPWDNWACNDTDESSSWRSYKVDSFHFDLEKADTDAKDSWGASGRVDYP